MSIALTLRTLPFPTEFMTLRVTLEIVPFGVEENKRTIHTININNITGISNVPDVGQHEYEVISDGQKQEWTVKHTRSLGARLLVRKVLDKLLV